MLQYQFKKNGVAIDGATDPTMSLSDITEDDNGRYTLDVTESVTGKKRTYGPLVVDGASGVSVDGLIEVSTGDLNAEGTIVLSFYPDPFGIVTVDPSEPVDGGGATFTFVPDTFTYQWKLNGSNITDADEATLTLTDADHTDNGSYTLLVENDRTGESRTFGPLVVEIEEPTDPTLPVTESLYSHLDAWAANAVLNSIGPDVAATNGQTVRRVLDQSGNSRHWNMSTDVDKPLFISSGMNSRPIIRFNSSLLAGSLPTSGTNTISIFLVYDTADTDWVFFGENNSTASEYPIRAQSGSTNTFWRSNSGAASNYVDGTLFTPTNRGDAYTSLTGKHCYIISGWSLTSWTRGDDLLLLGGYYNGSNALLGDVAELAVYAGTLDSTKISDLVAYSQAKWGTP